MRVKIFKTTAEEEDHKWTQMANRTIQERINLLFLLQKMTFPESFDLVTGKRKPLEHKITIKSR